jgi:hypothetical protein
MPLLDFAARAEMTAVVVCMCRPTFSYEDPITRSASHCGLMGSLFAHLILNAFGLPLVHHGHKGLDAAQAARD